MINVVRRLVSAARVGWARAMLLPRVAALGMRAPRNPHFGWDRFWSGIRATGDGGDVLWDTSNSSEANGYLELIRRELDPALPIVDVGCGNGRFTRALSHEFPRALGVDLSPHAIERARAESVDCPRATYLTLDAAAAGAGDVMRAEVGEANVFVRGVFHILDPQLRIDLAANLEVLVGRKGRVFLAETDYQGSSLGYIARLGATARRIPHALATAITSLPKPGHFGSAERVEVFPESRWRLVVDGATTIETVPMRGGAETERIPGYFAVLASRPRG
jgi:SAM-dependent methyltransferase